MAREGAYRYRVEGGGLELRSGGLRESAVRCATVRSQSVAKAQQAGRGEGRIGRWAARGMVSSGHRNLWQEG